MGRNTCFQFKQFTVIQEKTAMKVGTDGVLLGAWTHTGMARTILDVGTGTGLIALMMAQRTQAMITGIELEVNAAREAAGNCNRSPWHSRLRIIHDSYQHYAIRSSEKFDLIITNPPYFINDQKSRHQHLALAKHNDHLPLTDLVYYSVPLLAETGRLALILPVKPAQQIMEIAGENGLFLNRLTEVAPDRIKGTHRYLMEFAKKKTIPEKDRLFIHLDDKSDYTEDYKKLTRDFYLKF